MELDQKGIVDGRNQGNKRKENGVREFKWLALDNSIRQREEKKAAWVCSTAESRESQFNFQSPLPTIVCKFQLSWQ